MNAVDFCFNVKLVNVFRYRIRIDKQDCFFIIEFMRLKIIPLSKMIVPAIKFDKIYISL